jgi:hypothetical protein
MIGMVQHYVTLDYPLGSERKWHLIRGDIKKASNHHCKGNRDSYIETDESTSHVALVAQSDERIKSHSGYLSKTT